MTFQYHLLDHICFSFLQGGIAACLMYLDFFSMSAQRASLSITANCCQNMGSEEFHYVRESLPLLSGRLGQQVSR